MGAPPGSRPGLPWRSWLGLLLLCLAVLVSCVRADLGASSHTGPLSSTVRRGLRELEVHEDLFDLDEAALQAELRRLVVDIARVHGNLSENFDPDGRGRRLAEVGKFDIASCLYDLQGTIRDEKERNPYKKWRCPWYHETWPQDKKNKWFGCTGVSIIVNQHDEINTALYVVDRVINPVGGYTSCLLTALNAAVSKWCAYKADQEKLSVEDIWIKLYGVEVKQELTDYGSPGANAVIKALRQKLYGGLKFFGDYLGIGFAKSAADGIGPVVRSAYSTQQVIDQWCAGTSDIVKWFDRYNTIKSVAGAAFAPFKLYFPTFMLEPECEYWNMKAKEWEAGGFKNTFFRNPACGMTRRLDDETTPMHTNASWANTTRRTQAITLDEISTNLRRIIDAKMAPLDTFIGFAMELKKAEDFVKEIWEETFEPAANAVADVVETFQDVIALIGGVLRGLFGDILDVFGTILEKVADLLCFSLDDGPPKDCGFISLIIKVVKAIISTIVSALDSLLSWVQELIQQAIFKAIPEIKLLFRKLDFSEITKFFTDTKDKVRQKIVDFLNTMKEELGINKLYYVPAIDEYLRAHVWAEPSRKFITQQATVSGAPVLSFACDPGFYPVVEHAFFHSDICEEKDYGRYIRFPCKESSATPYQCSVSLAPFVAGCLASPPLSPEVALFASKVERYFAKATYTCYDKNVNISVIGELESYPIKNGVRQLRLQAGEQLAFDYAVTSYPNSTEVNRNDQVIYVAAMQGTRHNPCYDDDWIGSDVYRQFLCYYIASTGQEPVGGIIGNTMTESVEQYRSALPGYYQRNTCQSRYFVDKGPTGTGTNKSLECSAQDDLYLYYLFTTVTTFEDCNGIALNEDPYLWRIHTNFFYYSGPGSGGAWTRPLAYRYFRNIVAQCCPNLNLPLACTESQFDPYGTDCLNACFATGICQNVVFDDQWTYSRTCSGATPSDNYFDNPYLFPVRRAELESKFQAFKAWTDRSPLSTDCVARIASCTGAKSCDFRDCKLRRLDHIKTNKLAPALNNSRVVFAFYGGGIKFGQNNDYEEQLRCNYDMTPVIISLDAGWAPATSYFFNVSTEMPLKTDATTNTPYYSLRPKDLRGKMLAEQKGPDTVSADDIITFRAEYVCNCPAGYELRSGRFNDINSCSRCSPGTIRRASDIACAPCPIGTYEVDRTSCVPCPGGTYGIVPGGNGSAEACAPCPPLMISNPGSTGCYLCSTIKNNTYGLPSGTECGDCPVGTYFPQKLGDNDNSTLAIGGCLPCPDGYYRNADMLECAKAPAGYYVGSNSTRNATLQARRHRHLASMEGISITRRALIYSVDTLRRVLAEAQFADNKTNPAPRYLLPCPPGTFSTGLTGSSCPPCSEGSYQPLYHQDRCIPCDVGLTTLRFGATSVDECVVPPPPPVEPVYPTHLTCAQLLMEYRNSTLELQFVGDGLCNPGILNTPNCDYDGGDCCPQSCRRGKNNLVLADGGLDIDTYSNWTTDASVIEWLQNATVPTLALNYSYSCAAGTFVCKDPSVINRSLDCPPFEAPTTDTFLNASCGLYNFDPRYGDGFCDPALNYKECNYDGGDCCEPTCKVNPIVPGGCTPASLGTCRDPLAGDWGTAYINPPVFYAECRPFFFSTGLSNLRVRTKVTAGITPCAQRQVNVTEARATIQRGGGCLGNFTYKRNWRITELTTGLARVHDQDVYISNTLPPPYTPQPTCLWRPRIFNSSAAPAYNLGLVTSSPFFNFGKPDICSVRLSVTLLNCTNVGATAGSSSAQCLYNATTDRLSLSSLEDGDLWNITVRLTDSCGNTNVVWSPLLVSFTNDPEAPDSVTLNGIDYPCIDTTYCPNRLVDARQPSPSNKLANVTAQVCTAAEFQPISSSFVRLCLSATRNRPECADSASSGRLRAVFLNSNGLGIADPSAVSVINGSLKFGNACLPALPSERVETCGGWGVQGDADRFYNIGWEVEDMAFARLENGTADLGCIFFEASDWTAPPTGVEVGLAYSDLGGDSSTITSTMVGRVCIPRPPAIPVPNADHNIISTRLPSDGGDGPPVCVRVSPPRDFGASTTRVCLAVTNQYPGCANSAASGRLDYVLLDSTRIGVVDPNQLSFESGWVPAGGPGIHVTRPYCLRYPTNATNPPPLDCLVPLGIPQPLRIRGNLLTVALPISNVTWQSADSELGCFFVTSPNLYALNRSLPADRFKDWAFAFHFSEVPIGDGSGGRTTSYMGGAAFSDPVGLSAPSTATACPRNAVTVRVPQGDDGATTSQVCTVTDVKSVDPYTLEVCLSVDDTLPACSASSLQGQLRSVFMDSRGFGVSDPGDISIEDGTIELTRPYCRGEGLLACQGQNVSGVASPVGLPSFNQAFTVRNTVAWTGTRQTALGCFYVKRVDGLQFSPPAPPGSGWSMAFTYSDTEGGRHAVSAAKLCRSDPPVLSEVNAERTVISTRLPSDSGDAPLVCVVVRPPVAVDRSTTAICLDTTTQYPGCVGSATSGRLDWLMLDTTRLGVADPTWLNFESGPMRAGEGIQVASPYCLRYPTNATNPPPLDCLTPAGISQPPRIRGNLLTVALPITNVTWQSADSELGCIYVTSPNMYPDGEEVPPTRFEDWAFAFYFSEVMSSISRRRALAMTAAGGSTTYVGGVSFYEPAPSNATSTATQCANNAVTLRVPQADKQGSTSQVCTATNITSIDPFTLEVCLSVDDTLPGCVSSSLQGRLRGVFLDSRAFGGVEPNQLSLEDGTIKLARPYCKQDGLSTCQGQNVSGVAWTDQTRFNMAFALANDVSWTGTRRAALGCFYTKRVDGVEFSPPADGWSVGVAYSDTEGGRRAVSAARLCLPPVAPLLQVSAASQAAIARKWWLTIGNDTVCPAPTMVVDKAVPRLGSAHGDPDKIYKTFSSVCTRVDVARVDHRKFEVCLSVPAGGRGRCKGAMYNGTLAAIYFDSAAFGAAPPALTIEDGTMKVATPICTSSNGQRKQGRVEQCGGPYTQLHPKGRKKNLVLDMGFAVAESIPISSTQTADRPLGCFFVTGPPGFSPAALLPKGWSMALRFNRLPMAGWDPKNRGKTKTQPYTYSIMADNLCRKTL